MSGRVWAYIGVLLGGAVSIAANVAHSYVPPAGAAADWQPHAGAVGGAVFWPLGLFVALEVFARVAWPKGWQWVAVRFGGLLPVALLAAFVSYRHLSGLLVYYGEDRLTSLAGPAAIDGLMVISTAALIATGKRTEAPNLVHNINEVASVATAVDLPERPAPVTAPVRTPRVDSTLAKVTAARARKPHASQDTIAKVTGLAVRTVKRHWQVAEPVKARPASSNGHGEIGTIVPETEFVPDTAEALS